MPNFTLAPASTTDAPFTSIDAFSNALFDHSDLNSSFDKAEFEFVARSVELVTQSQAFSRDGLRFALRLTPELADRITVVLEQLGVIATGKAGAAREVLVDPQDLPAVLAILRAYRQDRSA